MDANELNAEARTERDGMELLLFYLGDECYGIDILRVKEVIPCPPMTQVPHSHPSVSGVIQLRGAPLTVVDLKKAIGDGKSLREDINGSVIITEYLEGRQGFLVTRVDRIIHCSNGEFRDSPPGTGETHYIEKVARVDEDLIQVLDMEKILAKVLPKAGRVSQVA